MNKCELKDHFLQNTSDGEILTRKEVLIKTESLGINSRIGHMMLIAGYPEILKVDRGKYKFHSSPPAGGSNTVVKNAPARPRVARKGVASTVPAQTVIEKNDDVSVSLRTVSSVSDDEIYIPAKDPNYIKWGEYSNIKKIVKSKIFFPTYVSGMSGNGKTMMIEQVCADLGREYVRVQVNPETDEDDLIGGFRLIDGETVFQKGPVVKAMERGCILLIDEIDRATNKIMCLQGVLEGSPILLKKTGEVITPAAGFNVISTANTKGRGSDEGRYTAATIIDDAFLERFVAVVDQKYPPYATEKKILLANAQSRDVGDVEFVDKLVAWSNVIRKTFDADGIDEVVSTRRLCHIIKAYSIFPDRMGAIKMCVSRFEEEVRDAFLDLYSKIDQSTLDENGEIVQPTGPEEAPF